MVEALLVIGMVLTVVLVVQAHLCRVMEIHRQE